MAYEHRVGALVRELWLQEKRVFVSRRRAAKLLGVGQNKLKEMMEVAGWTQEKLLIHHLVILPDLYYRLTTKGDK